MGTLAAFALLITTATLLWAAETWDEMASYTGAVNLGSGICHAAGTDTIYALCGNNTKTFRGYSISNNAWTALANIPTNRLFGKGLCHVKGSDTVYALRADGLGAQMYGYSISRDTWVTLAASPGIFNIGNALCYPGSGDTIYAIRGFTTTHFYGYSISRDTWVTLAALPGTMISGADLCFVQGGDTLYALRGDATQDFYGYSISRNTWTTLAATPSPVGLGGSIGYPGCGDTIYAIRGTDNTAVATTTFWGYSLSRNAWDTHTAVPLACGSGACMTSTGDTYLYVLRGNGGNEYYRFTVDMSGLAPAAPYNTTQWDKTGAALASGDSIVIYETVTLSAMSDHLLLPSDTFWIEFELRETGTAFTSPSEPAVDNYTFFRSAASASSAAETLAVTASGLKRGEYKWQVRAVGPKGDTTAWTYSGKGFYVAVKACTELFPVNRVATPAETNPTGALPRAAQDTFLQTYLGNGDTTGGTLRNAANETGIGANYAETRPLLSGVDTISIHYWTNQRFIQTFTGLRTDTLTLDTNGLPAGIQATDTGRTALGNTVLLLNIADASGYPGDTRTSRSVKDSVVFTMRFYLSETTARLYRSLGFDTAPGSGSFGLYGADTYGGRWNHVANCRVIAAPAPWCLCITVTGASRTNVLGLGAAASSASGGAGGGCLVTRLGAPDFLLVWLRSLRDWTMSTCVGRLLAAGYYALG